MTGSLRMISFFDRLLVTQCRKMGFLHQEIKKILFELKMVDKVFKWSPMVIIYFLKNIGTGFSRISGGFRRFSRYTDRSGRENI